MVKYLLVLLVFFSSISENIYSQGWMDKGTVLQESYNGISPVRHALVYNDGSTDRLLVVGGFKTTPYMIGEWNGTEWVQFGTSAAFSTSGNSTDIIYDAIVFDNELYIAGSFVIKEGSDPTIRHLAKWDETNDKWVSTSGGTDLIGVVYDLEIYNNELYVGGDFSSHATANSPNIVRYDGTSWNNVGGGTSENDDIGQDKDQVRAMAVFDNLLVVGGEFDVVDVGNTDINVRNIATWDGTTWAITGGTSLQHTGPNEAGNGLVTVASLATYTDGNSLTYLYVGGNFTSVFDVNHPSSDLDGNIPNTQRLAIWKNSTFDDWDNMEDNSVTPPGEVSNMTEFNGKLWLSGDNFIYSVDNTPGSASWTEEPSLESIFEFEGLTVIDGKLVGLSNTYYEYADPFPAIAEDGSDQACVGVAESFTDASIASGTIQSWSWTFEGADVTSSIDQNPTATWSAAGTYDVTLEISDGVNTSTRTYTDYVTVSAPPSVEAGPDINMTYLDGTSVLLNDDASPAGGVWSGTVDSSFGGTLNFTNQIDANFVKPGTYELTYTYTSGGCEISDTRQLIVAKADQTITWQDIPDGQYSKQSVAVSASTDGKYLDGSAIEITFELVSGTGTFTSASVLKIESSGDFDILAKAPESELYNAANVSEIFTMAKGEQEINGFNPTSIVVFGIGDFGPGGVSQFINGNNTGLVIDYVSSDETVIIIKEDNTISVVGAGEATITASQPGNEHINPAVPVERTITVEKASQSIISDNINEEYSYSEEPVQFTATSDAGIDATFVITDGPGFFSGDNLDFYNFNGIGTVTLSIFAPGNDNYTSSVPVSKTFTVVKADQVIDNGSFTIDEGSVENKTYKPEPFILGGTASSGLDLTFEVGNYASINGNELTIEEADREFVVTAKQEGNEFYNAASPASFSFVVVKATPTLTVTNPGDQYMGSEFQIEAEFDSDQTLTVYSNTGYSTMDGLNGAVGDLVYSGNETITLQLESNPRYNSLTESISFCILYSKPIIDVVGSGTFVTLESNGTLSDQTQWFKNGTETGTGIQLILSGSEAEGTYTVQGTAYDGCPSSELSDPVDIIITDLSDEVTKEDLSLYPNPVGNDFKISHFQNTINKIEAVDLRGVVTNLDFEKIEDGWHVRAGKLSQGSYIIRLYTDASIFNKTITKK